MINRVNKIYMSKSFTLIELMVTIGIVILLTAVSVPALDLERNRTSLDAGAKQIRDSISHTQIYAFGPENPAATGYLYVLNIDSNSSHSYGSATLLPKEYVIFSMVGVTRSVVKRGKIDTTGTISFDNQASQGPGYYDDPNKLFKIHFRTSDGAAGCAGVYYDTAGSAWGTSCVPDATKNYAELTITLNNKSKKVRVHKVTGENEVSS